MRTGDRHPAASSRQRIVGRKQFEESITSECGMILIALLWIFIALAAIVMSFARESRVEAAAVHNSQSLGKAYYVARAAVSETIYRLAYERFASQSQQTTPDEEPTLPPETPLPEHDPNVPEPDGSPPFELNAKQAFFV